MTSDDLDPFKVRHQNMNRKVAPNKLKIHKSINQVLLKIIKLKRDEKSQSFSCKISPKMTFLPIFFGAIKIITSHEELITLLLHKNIGVGY